MKPGLHFRAKLLVAMMLVALAMTLLGLWLAQRKILAEAERESQQQFRYELAAVHAAQEIRHAALTERCRALVQRPRIHAALEDNALDLLYLSARDELRDVMEHHAEAPDGMLEHPLQARFYRFLDARGAVISPPAAEEVGALRPEEEAQLALPAMPEGQQIGYLARRGEAVDEVIAMPITSTETGEGIGVLVLGFKPIGVGRADAGKEFRSGLWAGGHLLWPGLGDESAAAIGAEMTRALGRPDGVGRSLPITLAGVPHLLFYKQLNPGSLFPAGYEVAVYSLARTLARQQRSRWQILSAGAALLLAGLLASHVLAGRLSAPVEKLAVDSEEHRIQRARAEAALEARGRELARAARFSADASHQLKTPVSVLRAGLDEILAERSLSPKAREEVAALVHQTYRLTGIIEDLLLLSRMDAGRLNLDLEPVDLTLLLEGLIDDLSALPDDLKLDIETDCPALRISGERRYVALIVQNVLENARKYNCPGGRIRIACREEGDTAILSIGNTGPGIPEPAREHIFERFHRGASGENVPGHGLGLDLARELARLHGGDLRLVRSDAQWTEFETRFCLAPKV